MNTLSPMECVEKPYTVKRVYSWWFTCGIYYDDQLLLAVGERRQAEIVCATLNGAHASGMMRANLLLIMMNEDHDV